MQLLSMAAFTMAFFGWLNETWLYWFENPVWLNRYTEYAIILGFGIWRIMAERNPYTRKRFIILVSIVTVFWWLIPWLHPVYEFYVGFLWAQPVFPSLHVPGKVTFFLVLGLVFLFVRRIICGFGCPCVGIRETVGFPFRNKTPRSRWTWRLLWNSMESAGTAERERVQDVMRAVCQDCHSPRYIIRLFDNGEQMLDIGRMKVHEAAGVLEQAGGNFTGAELAAAREHLVRMQSLHLENLYLGIGHQSPDYQWWHGQPALDGDLLRIKGTLGELYRIPVRSNSKGGGEW